MVMTVQPVQLTIMATGITEPVQVRVVLLAWCSLRPCVLKLVMPVRLRPKIPTIPRFEITLLTHLLKLFSDVRRVVKKCPECTFEQCVHSITVILYMSATTASR